MYTVDYFIQKFQSIPTPEWTTGVFKSFEGRKCALGHCLDDRTLARVEAAGCENGTSLYKPTQSELTNEFAESYQLSKLFDPSSPHNGSGKVISINNGTDPRYQQPTPKQRILAALYDIRDIEKKKDTDTSGKKERIVYVSVPATITEQSKDLVMS